MIIPRRRAVGLTYAVGKASAGAVEYVPVARVTNMAAAIEELKERGVWIYATDLDGETWCSVDYSGPVALVIGNEGQGVSRLVKEKSDFVVTLPMVGQIQSLNASVACGILCYEVARQRQREPDNTFRPPPRLFPAGFICEEMFNDRFRSVEYMMKNKKKKKLRRHWRIKICTRRLCRKPSVSAPLTQYQ